MESVEVRGNPRLKESPRPAVDDRPNAVAFFAVDWAANDSVADSVGLLLAMIVSAGTAVPWSMTAPADVVVLIE